MWNLHKLKLYRNNIERKNTIVVQMCVLWDASERLQVLSRSFSDSSYSFIIWVRIYLFLESYTLPQKDLFLTMFFTINSSPFFVTPSNFVCKYKFWVITKRVMPLTKWWYFWEYTKQTTLFNETINRCGKIKTSLLAMTRAS